MVAMSNNIPYKDEIPVGRAEDLRGQKFHNLTVLYRIKNKGKNRSPYWKCQCSCGNTTEASSSNLKTENTKSCGCLVSTNLIGKKFGLLTVLEPTKQRTKDRNIVWKCKCECENIFYIDTHSLTRGNTKSCGCITNAKDISNQRFGKLIALKPTKNKKRDCIVWECLCDCGNICYINTANLTSGNTQSCGCMNSKGEALITKILLNENIFFETQKSFDDCRFENNYLARFDFYVNNSYLIEYDGIQHFEYAENGWNTKEKYLKTKSNDKYKNKWCQDNNIPLIRIPYTKLDSLCVKDLMLETTQFRIV